MGVLQQLKLLFKKNFLLRKRQPGILALEVLWPLFIVIIITVIRQGVPPKEKETCHFQERAMPSAGVVPFLQTFVCNMDNKCQSRQELEKSQHVTSQISALVDNLAPYIGSTDTVEALESMQKGVKIIQTLKKMMLNNSMLEQLDKPLMVKTLFRDPEKVKQILMDGYGFTNEETLDALMNSSIIIARVLDLVGYSNLREIVCKPDLLTTFLLFRDSVNTTDLSRDLCNIDLDKIPEITRVLQSNIDVAEIVRLLGLFEKFREIFSPDYVYPVSQGFNDIADMLDLVFKSPSIQKLMMSMSSLKDLSPILRNIPKYIDMFQEGKFDLKPFMEFIKMLNPIVEQITPKDPIWHSIVDGVTMANNIVHMLEGDFNGTTTDIVNIVDKFLMNLESALSGLSPDVKLIMETIADLNIGDIFNQIVTGTLKDKKVTDSLNELQVTLEKMSMWNMTAPVVSVLNKLMQMANVTIHQSLYLEEALVQALGTDGNLQTTFRHIIEKGPKVTKAVLDAFTDSKVIAKMFRESFSYSSLCTGVIQTIETELGSAIANDLRLILCNAGAAQGVQSLISSLQLDRIQNVLNDTVELIRNISMGKINIHGEETKFSTLYTTTKDLIATSVIFAQVSQQTWGELFSSFKTNAIDFHRREWYPVLQMMDTNYLGTSMIAMLRALGETMYEFPLVEPMSKIVHMANLGMNYAYTTLKTSADLYGTESPMGKLVHYASQYAPELTKAVMDMMKDKTVIYDLIDSDNAYTTVCSNNWMGEITLPSYVPMADIETLICQTDWQGMIQNLAGQQQTILMMEMQKTIRYWGDSSQRYNMSSDWISVMDITERTVNMLSDKDTLASMMGMPNLIMNMNFTNVMKAFDIIEHKFSHMTTDDFTRLLEIGVFMIEQFDTIITDGAKMLFQQSYPNQNGNLTDFIPPYWIEAKKALVLLTGYFKMTNILFEKGLDMSSIKDSIKQYSPIVRDIVTKTAEMTPSLISAVKDTILNPEKLLTKFKTLMFKAPDCVSVLLSDYMVDPDNTLHQYERYLCQLNLTELAMSLNQQSPEILEFQSVIMLYMYNSGNTNVKVNWTELAKGIDNFINLMEQQVQMTYNPDYLLPFNLTALDMSWTDFVHGIKSLQKVDHVRLQNLIFQMQDMFMLMNNGTEGNNSTFIDQIFKLQATQNYLSVVITKFIVSNLEFMNSTENVRILDHLGSQEIKDIFKALELSPDIVQILFNTILSYYDDPSKVTQLTNPQIWATICNDSTIFSHVFDLRGVVTPPQKIQQTLCNIEFDPMRILYELMANWPGFGNMAHYFVEASVGNLTMKEMKVDYKQVEVLNERMSTLIQSLITIPRNFILTNNTAWMASAAYEDKWMDFTNELNKTMDKFNDIRYLVEYQLRSVVSSQFDEQSKAYLMKIFHYIETILEINANLSQVSIPEEFQGSPNMISLMEALQYTPEAIEVFVNTALNSGDKLSQFMGMVVYPGAKEQVCNNVDMYFDVPAELEFNLTMFMDFICSVNFTQLEYEAENLEMFAIKSDSVPDFKSIADKLVTIFEKVEKTGRVGINFRAFDTTIYEHMLTRLEKYLNQSAEQIMKPEYLMKSLGQLYNTPGLIPGLASWLPRTVATLDTVLDVFLTVENETSFALSEWFRGAPQLQALVNLIQEPGVIETLLNSLNSPKMQPLLMNPNFTSVLMVICDPRTDMNNYLVAPVGVDVNSLRNDFCQVNFTQLLVEAEWKFKLNWTIEVAELKVDFDWTSFGKKYQRVYDLITKWIENPPIIQVPDDWKNGTYWLQMLERFNERRMSPEAITAEIQNLLNSLAPFSKQPGFREFGLILEKILRIANENMLSLENKTLTVENMLYTIPVLRDVMSAMGLSGDVLTTILTAPVKNPRVFLSILLQQDSRNKFCSNNSLWYTIFELPDSFDVSPVNRAICNNNATVLLENLVRNLNIEDLIMKLQNSSYSVDPQRLLMLSQQLGKNIESFMKFKPKFDEAEFLKHMRNMYSDANVIKMLAVYSAVAQVTVGQSIHGGDVFLRSSTAIYEFLNNLMEKFQIKGVTLDIASIFEGSPTFMRILRTVMTLTPDPVNGLLGIQLKTSKNMEFTRLIMNPVKLNELFCSEAKFREYFNTPDSLNITIIINGMCNINFTLIGSELANSFHVNSLIQKLHESANTPFDIENYIQQYQKFSELLTKFIEIRNATFEGRNLEKIFDVNGTILSQTFMKMLEANGVDYTNLPTQIINSLLEGMNATDSDNLISKYLAIFDMYLKLMNENLRYIKDKPLSLELLVNRTEYGPVVMTVLMEPEWLEDLVQIQFKPQQLMNLFNNGSKTLLCSPAFWDAFILPANDSGALQHLQQRLCAANFTIMEWQLITMQVKGYQFLQQVKEIEKKWDTGQIKLNATELDFDIKEMIQLVTDIIKSYTSGKQPIKEFVNVQGFKTILDKFNGALGQKVLNLTSVWANSINGIFWRLTDTSTINGTMVSNSTMVVSNTQKGIASLASRMMNTMNIFFKLINDRLEDILDGQISVSSLLGNTQPLVSIMEAYINLGMNGAQGLIHEVDYARMNSVLTNMTLLNNLCNDQSLASYLNGDQPALETHRNLETILCSFNDLPQEFKQYIDYDQIAQQINSIWNMSLSVKPDIQAYIDNMKKFQDLLTQLSQKHFMVDNKLKQVFDGKNILKIIENLFSSPTIIFKIMELAGGQVDNMVKDKMLSPILSILNQFIVSPMSKMMSLLTANGITLQSMLTDPMKLLKAVEILSRYDNQMDYSSSYLSTILLPLSNNANMTTHVLCNYTALYSVLKTLEMPHFDQIQPIMCSKPATMWPEEFRKFNMSTDDLINVYFLLSPVLVKYQCRTVSEFGFECAVPDLQDHSFTFVRFLQSIEKLTNLFMTTGDSISSLWKQPESSLNVIMKILKNIFIETPVYGGLHMLKTVDMDSRIQKSFGGSQWQSIKQLFKIFNSFESMINRNLERIINSAQPVKVGDILPDNQKVTEALSKLLGTDMGAQFMMLIVNPQKFMELAFLDNWENIACNMSVFRETFSVSEIPGIDVTGIQTSLCQSATTQKAALKQFVDLLDAGSILEEVNKLMKMNFMNSTNYNNTNEPGLWESLLIGTKKLMANLDKLNEISFNGDSMNSWFAPVMNMLGMLYTPNKAEEICQNAISYASQNPDYLRNIQPLLKVISQYFYLVANQLSLYNNMDDVVCELTSEFNITKTLKRLNDFHVFDMFTNLNAVNLSAPFNCGKMISRTMDIINAYNQTLFYGPDYNRVGQCLTDVGEKRFETFLSSLDSIFEISSDMLQLIQKPEAITALRSISPEIKPILDYIFSTFNKQKSVVLTLGEVFTNSSSVSDYFINALKLTPYLTESILKSTINLDSSRFLNESVQEITNILCDADRLAGVISLPSFIPMNYASISKLLCNNGSLDTAIAIKSTTDFARITEQVLSLVDTGVDRRWLSNITGHAVNLINDLQELSGIIDLLGGGLNLVNIQKDAGKIDRFLMGSGPDRVVRSLTAILDDLRYVFPNNQSQVILGEISLFLKGFMGIDLIQSRILKALTVSDLLKDPLRVERYMVDELGFTQEMAKDILGGTYSVRVFLNATNMISEDGFDCNSLFDSWVRLNTTSVTMSEITKIMCSLNKTQATKLAEKLLPELDIGDMVKMYVTASADELLKSSNLTMDDARDLTEKLSRAQVGLQKAAKVLHSNNSLQNDILAELIKAGQPQAQAQTGGPEARLLSVEDILCGRGKSNKTLVKDSFNVNSFLSYNNPEVKQEELDSLPQSEFCRNIYREIMTKSIGSIIWSYLKPIMRGKILYTPNTPLTRAIINEADSTFSTLQKVKKVAEAWVVGAPELVTLTEEAKDMDNIKKALSSDFIKKFLASSAGLNTDELVKGLAALESDQFTKEQMEGMAYVAQLIVNYTECMELHRFEGFDSEVEMLKRSKVLANKMSLLAGVVFMPETDTNDRSKRDTHLDIPRHISYTIRMDNDNVQTTFRLKRRMWKPGPDADFAADMRYQRGFMQLQDMIDQAIIKLHGKGGMMGDNSTMMGDNSTMMGNNSTTMMEDPGVYLQQFPYPCYIEDDYIHYLGSYLLPVMFTFAWLAALGIATRNLVYDREDGQEEVLKIMGMKYGLSWIAWFLSTMFLMIIVCLIMALILKYGTVFRLSNFFIIFLYMVAFCLSSTMLCYFVSAFFTRTTLAILTVLIVYFLSYLPYIVLISMEVHMVFWQKIVACLSCTTAFSFGAQFLAAFEERGEGIQWNNVQEQTRVDDRMTFHWSCIMMLIDSAIYFVFGWYVRNVKSGKYGVSKPWYFICVPSYWCSKVGRSRKSDYLFDVKSGPREMDVLSEEVPANLPVGIATHNLRKVYNKKTAVNNLSINFYENQVTALLGHNGAAKSTTMNMITGVLQPTSGHVEIYNESTSNITGILGICPQHNTIFDFMTVLEHMEFYAGMKTNNVSQEEIRNLLKDVDLWHVRRAQGKNLSGGMQRRLCVALAFVGGSRAIVLDEPTSGVDPYARKQIWNLILKHKFGRTVLVSTHHLDEADMIGDRVAILHTGKLLCSGSPVFLKSMIGGGLSLTLEKQLPSPSTSSSQSENMCTATDVMAFIREYHPGAMMTEDIGTEMEVRLPKDTNTATWCQFFHDLDDNKHKLNVASYGVSDATLEDVFLKVTTIVDSGKELNMSILTEDVRRRNRSGSDNSDSISDVSSEGHLVEIKGEKARKSGCGLTMQQYGAFLLKRFHHYRRDWRMIISALVLPVVLVLAAVGFSMIRPFKLDMPRLVLTPALYGPDNYIFMKDSSGNAHSREIHDSMMKYPSLSTVCMNGYNPSMSSMGKDIFECIPESRLQHTMIPHNKSSIPICRCDNHHHICDKMSSTPSPDQMMLKTSNILQQINDKIDIDSYLLDSYPQFIDKRFGGITIETVNGKPHHKVWYNNKGYHAMPSFRNAYSNMMLRSKVSPEHASQYGITVYTHPLPSDAQPLSSDVIEQNAADAGIAVILLMAFSFIPSALILVSIGERLNNEKHIQTVSGVGPLSYWISTFTWDMFVYLISVVCAVIIIAGFQPEAYYNKSNLAGFTCLLVLFGWAVLPMMYSILKIFKTGSGAYLVLFCFNMFLGVSTIVVMLSLILFSYIESVSAIREILHYVFLIFPQYCLCQGLIDLSTNQFRFKLFKHYGEDVYAEPFSFDLIAWNFIAMAIQGLVFFIITVIIEYKPETSDRIPSEMLGDYHKEEDVQHEADRITQNNDDMFVVNNLSKVFRRGMSKFLAVDNISFGVQRGECFGLLGVNGAGKTTSFKMLTGEMTSSHGFAALLGKRITGGNSDILRNIGYCPQTAGLDEYLSAEELLLFYARIKGLSGENAKSTVKGLIEKLKLTQYAQQAIKTYSGGNKRKVSLAIAMLGDPDILFLDEPTTGMDPGTRRLAWKTINTATRNGQAVILTSHSMDECDHLCSRLAIMVNGQLKCLGSPQHLKNKFGDGYIVRVNIPDINTSKMDVVQAFMDKFPGTSVKEETSQTLQLDIPKESGRVAQIFTLLEQQQLNKDVLEYSLSQTSLDEVFINFAKDQSDNLSEGDRSSTSGSSKPSISTQPSFKSASTINKYAFMNPSYDTFGSKTGLEIKPVDDLEYSDNWTKVRL